MKKRPLPTGTIIHSKKGKKVFSGVLYDVYQWIQKEWDGKDAVYEILKRKDTVSIIPVIDNEVVLVEEHQPHWDRKGLSIISGGVEDGEDLEEAARRELLEETGMVFKDFYLVSVDRAGPLEWFIYTFIAKNLISQGEKKLDAGEKNRVLKVGFKKLIENARKKKFYGRPFFVENHLISGNVEKLFSVFKNPKKYII